MKYQDQKLGLIVKTIDQKYKIYSLMEYNEKIKDFSQEEVNQILNGTLDYTQFFKQPDSKEKLLKVIRGREMSLGFTEPKDF